jgi:hypothetical protein
LVVGVQGRSHGGKGWHEPAGGKICPVTAAQQPLDLVCLAHYEASVAALDQRGSAEQQAMTRASKAEIVVAFFTETPDFVNHCRPLLVDSFGHSMRDYRLIFIYNCQLRSDLT